MQSIKRIFGWLASKAILYVALVIAILAGSFVGPWLNKEWHEPHRMLERAAQVEGQVVQPLTDERDKRQNELAEAGARAKNKTLAQLQVAIGEAEVSRDKAIKSRRNEIEKGISLGKVDMGTLLKDRHLELEIHYLDAEIEGLRAAHNHLKKKKLLESLPSVPGDARAEANRARAACRTERLAFEKSEARWQVKVTLDFYEKAQRGAQKKRKDDACGKSSWADKQQIAQQRYNEANLAFQKALPWTEAKIRSVTSDVEAEILEERRRANSSWGERAWLFVKLHHTTFQLAGYALAAIIATPFLIRLLCYFVLAPVAMRRPAVRILATVPSDVSIPLSQRSTTSVGVQLAAGEELLVRTGYLQTTSEAGSKGTQWLLDGRHPITSLVTGLNFLTRIRGEGQITTVSAVNDPFAEVTILTLPDGAACVLQPRALAAVVQPIGQRLRVTGHWRLFTLNAWLTLQLRYLVFHGPARLVLKGGRGVRVERAESGRILGQDQVLGFSTDLAYSVTRNETFWPYFFNREPLLRDRVAAGDGVLILEEAPMAGRRAGERRAGIEGFIDAGMKVFGM